MVSPVNGTSGVFIAARINKGGCGSFASQGIFFFVFPKKRIFDVYGDLGKHKQSTVKSVYSSHSKIDKAKILQTNVSLMKVKSIAECSL